MTFDENINQGVVNQVRTDLSNLAAKVDRLMDPYHPQHQQFLTLVSSVINLPLSAIASRQGWQAGWYVGKKWMTPAARSPRWHCRRQQRGRWV